MHMAFRAETVYITGHLVADQAASPAIGDQFLDNLHALEPNQHGFIEVGRIAQLSTLPGLRQITTRCIDDLGDMSRNPLPQEVKTIQPINLQPPIAAQFRFNILRGHAALLPKEIDTKLDALSQGVSDYGALHIRGFDIRGVGRATALALAKRIGEPYAEGNETDEIVQTIQPCDDEANLQTSGSFDTDLDAHVENVGQENVPDFLVLVCEDNIEQAETIVISPLQALWSMRRRGLYKEESLLWRDRFWVRTPMSFAQQDRRDHHKVVEGYAELPIVHADFADVGSEDGATQKAYGLFQKACLEEAQTIILQSGDALLLRNTGPSLHAPTALQVMHGRKPFTPNRITPRTLHRVYVHERR